MLARHTTATAVRKSRGNPVWCTAVALALGACSASATGGGGRGGSGGTQGTGGVEQGLGGAQARGGSQGAGGARASGGDEGLGGGGPIAGGASGSGGADSFGGVTGSGGRTGTGGTTGRAATGGQSGAVGGNTSVSGGAPGSGGLGGGGVSGRGGVAAIDAATPSSGGVPAAGGTQGGGGATSVTGPGGYDAIYTGSPWYDDRGNVINAHAAGAIKDNGKYYLFGESHSDTSNAFTAFNCYSSADLANWKFENQVLTVQPSGLLGPNRVGERAKVMKCPSTGEYVMFMHTDNLTYTDEYVGYATSPTVNGNYSFKGALQYSGGGIKKWDMGAFQDTDGTGYVLLNGGDIYKLASDYHSADSQVASGVSSGGESPAIFKAGSTYFFLFSNRTSWERNDNYYFTATALGGPWTSRGKFAPSGTLTWNSQTTFVLPITGSTGSTYVFLGDRWSYPRQGSAATYVWQPLVVSGTGLSIPTFYEAWKIDQEAGTWSAASPTGTSVDDGVYGTNIGQLAYTGTWAHTTGGGYDNTESRSATAGDSVSIRFTGTQIKLYGVASPDGGYATVAILDGSNASVVSTTIDCYSKYRDATNALKYVSPLLTRGSYTLKLVVIGAHSTWSDKAGTVYGSTGDYVSIDRAVIAD